MEGAPAPDQTLRAHRVADGTGLVSGTVAWASMSSAEPLGQRVFLLPFQDFRLGGLAIQAMTDSSLRAQLAGSFSVDALTNAMRIETSSDGGLTHLFFEQQADIDPSGRDPMICERISAGFELEAVPVELVTP